MFGTSNGPNRRVFVDRMKDDCRLHSADASERNRNDGNGFLSPVFHNDRTYEPWRWMHLRCNKEFRRLKSFSLPDRASQGEDGRSFLAHRWCGEVGGEIAHDASDL